MPSDKTHEWRLRRQLKSQFGYELHKSRSRLSCYNFGGYSIVCNGCLVAGSNFELDLEDVEQFIRECQEKDSAGL